MDRPKGLTFAVLFSASLIALSGSGPGSSRYVELAHPPVPPVGDRGPFGWIWNNLCRHAGLDCDVQATIERGHEPKDGGNHGGLSDPLGLLRLVDSFQTRNPLEHHCRAREFLQCRRLFPFSPQRKSPTEERA